MRPLLLPCALLLSWPTLGSTIGAQGTPGPRLVDLSESGAVFSFGGGLQGSEDNPIELRLGPEASWDVLDFEVRAAEVGRSLTFHVLGMPGQLAPTSTSGGFRWEPVEVLEQAGEAQRLRITPETSRFVVRLRPHIVPEAAYYTWPRFVTFMASLEQEPLAQVTQVGSSIQGRPLYRILIDDPSFAGPKKTVLAVVRQHGDEFGSSYVLEGLVNALLDRPLGTTRSSGPGTSAAELAGLPTGLGQARELRSVRWIIYPLMNPDGAVAQQRGNANGVDLNRDWDREGSNASQEPETLAIQSDLELLDALYGVDVAGDHHGWTNGTHGGFRYAPLSPPASVSTPEYEEARKDTLLYTRHDPTQTNWVETGGVLGMLRVEMFYRMNFLIHTPEYDSLLSSAGLFREKGARWANAMLDTLFAPRFTDALGQPLTLGRIGGGIHVTVDDEDENDTGNPNDEVSVVVYDPVSGDAELLNLAELAPGGFFRNAVPLALATGSAQPGNGVLETSPGALIQARYVDDDYPRDRSSASLRIRLGP